ncbi:MAG: transporter substrate-binding domain-containing protein [gamma proteobacterium symbiont of Taylorina sp.]|nr:transporter substrate-binding domain-containing protein [gamma proteobacterium symbiont of Taylorina sp.]
MLFLCLLLINNAVFCSQERKSEENARVISFPENNIKLTPQEQIFIKEHPQIVLASGSSFEPFTVLNPNGSISGFDVDVMSLVTKKSGLNVVFSLGKWSEIQEKALKREYDGLSSTVITESRKQHYNFSVPYLKLFFFAFVKKGNPQHIYKLKDLDGKRIALQRGNLAFEKLAHNLGKNFKYVYYDTIHDLILAVVSGEADFTILDESAHYIAQTLGLSNSVEEAFAIDKKPSELFFALRNDYPELLSIINKSLQSISKIELLEIRRKWFGRNGRSQLNLQNMRPPNLILSQTEKNFIASHPVMTVANEMDWPPFDFNEFGKPKGLAIDHIKLLAEKAGFKIKFINHLTWDELLGRFKKKQIDIIPGLYRNKQRESFTLYTPAYFRGKLGIYSNNNLSIHSLSDLEGKHVGIQKSHGAIPIIKEKAPNIHLLEDSSPENLVKMLATDKLDAIIGNPLLFSYFAKENQISSLKLSHYIEMTKDEQFNISLHIGVRKDYPILHQILTKAMTSVSDKEMMVIENKWHNTKNTPETAIFLTPEEQAFIAKHSLIKVSNEMDWPPFDFTIGKEPQGYSIEMLKLLAKRIGIRLEFINGYTWNELWEKFKRKELDLVHPVLVTDERKKYGLYTSRMYSGRQIFVTRKEAPKIDNFNQLQDKVFATPKGWALTTYIQKQYPQQQLLLTDSISEALDAVSNSLAYATADNNAVIGYQLNKNIRNDLKINGWFRQFDQEHKYNLHYLIRKDWPLLLHIFEKAKNSLTSSELSAMQNQWFGETKIFQSIGTNQVSLTGQERDYLNGKKNISFCVDPNWMPYEYLDDDGNHQGMAADFLQLIAKRLKTSVSLYPTQNWSNSLKALQQGYCDIITLANSTPSRHSYMNFSTPYLSFPYVIATTQDKFFIDDFEQHLDKSYAVVKDYAVTEELRKNYPKLHLIEVDSVFSGLKMLSEGKVFGYIGATAVINHSLQKYAILDVKLAGKLPWGYELSVASRSDEPILGSVIQKAVNSLEKNEIKRIKDKWIAVNTERVTDFTLLWQVLLVISIILSIVIYWNRKLNHAKLKLEFAQKQLRSKNRQLEEISVTDHLTRLYNRIKLDEVLQYEIKRANRLSSPFAIIILDIDFFKQVNDTYGHNIGDQILVELSQTLTNNLREIDILGRWGGEEFLIICPNTAQEGAMTLAENLRKSIEFHEFPEVKHKTASFGVAVFQKKDTAEIIIERADIALYKAKTSGRNMVVLG